jgi:hypothetical protein
MAELSVLQMIGGIWGVVTAVWIALAIYRSLIGMREEDTIYLSAGESKMESEQRVIHEQLSKLAPYTRGFGWASIALAIAFAAVWVFGVIRDLLR